MVEMTVKEILFEYDEPLVLAAQDKKDRPYIGLNTKDEDNGSLFLLAYVNDKDLFDFKNQEVDLRFLLTHGVKGIYRSAILFGEEGETFDAKPFKQSVEELLPSAGFFLPKPKMPNQNREIRSIVIDGSWGIDDLKNFPRVVQDVYAVAYSLKSNNSSVKSQIKTLFAKYPWRGGFSALNFFDNIYDAIPKNEEARINSMSYGSLGSIHLEVNTDIAEYIKTMIGNMLGDEKIQLKYHEIYDRLHQNKWLGRSAQDLKLSQRDKNYLRELISDFAQTLILRDRIPQVLFLAEEDPLAAIKILLAFYRKLEKLDHYVRTGRARDVFVERMPLPKKP